MPTSYLDLTCIVSWNLDWTYLGLFQQDLKDFARQSGLDVVYSETGRERDGKGFVEFETAADLKTAVDKLDNREFKGSRVSCVPDTQEERPRDYSRRSRSPYARRPYPPPEYEGRRGPSRGYSPRGPYRERTPPPRRYYDDHDRYGRSPPRAGYPPPRRAPYEDPYDPRPPPRGYEDPYVANGHGRPYPRPRSPPRGDYDYDHRRY